MASQPDQYELQVFDSNSMDWLEIPIEQIGSSLPLKLFTADPDTECLARFSLRRRIH